MSKCFLLMRVMAPACIGYGRLSLVDLRDTREPVLLK